MYCKEEHTHTPHTHTRTHTKNCSIWLYSNKTKQKNQNHLLQILKEKLYQLLIHINEALMCKKAKHKLNNIL